LKANIIHCSNGSARLPRLLKELEGQNITDYELWEGYHDTTSVVKSINLAHKSIVEYAQLAKWEEVLIMEDDIRFCGEGAFESFLANKPQSFDLYLGGIYNGQLDENNKVKRFTGFHCYIIHSRFYETFLSTPSEQHIDVSLDNLGEYYVSYPFTSIQYNGFSSNSKKEENYDSMLQNRLLHNNFVI